MLLLPVGMVIARLVLARRLAKRGPRVHLNVQVDVHPTATIALSLLKPATITVGRRHWLPFMRP